LNENGSAEDEIDTSAARPENFSPNRPNFLHEAQSQVVCLETEFDEVNGYESDGGAFFDVITEEGTLIQEEERVPDDATRPAEVEVVAVLVENEDEFVQDELPMIEDEELDKLKVTELKEQLEKQDLCTNGRKSVLQKRLKEGMNHKLANPTVDVVNEVQRQIAGFPVTARWKVLKPMEEVAPEPVNIFASYAPTVPAEDAAFVRVKHNSIDPIDGNDFIYRSFVANSERRHCHL
jgi:hypothetical protein